MVYIFLNIFSQKEVLLVPIIQWQVEGRIQKISNKTEKKMVYTLIDKISYSQKNLNISYLYYTVVIYSD